MINRILPDKKGVFYSTRRFVLSLALCYFVLVFFSPFSIAITSLGEERASVCFICACLFLSVSSSSSCLGRAAAWHSLDLSFTFFYTQDTCSVRVKGF